MLANRSDAGFVGLSFDLDPYEMGAWFCWYPRLSTPAYWAVCWANLKSVPAKTIQPDRSGQRDEHPTSRSNRSEGTTSAKLTNITTSKCHVIGIVPLFLQLIPEPIVILGSPGVDGDVFGSSLIAKGVQVVIETPSPLGQGGIEAEEGHVGCRDWLDVVAEV